MQRIGFVLSPGFQVMSFAALTVFEFANKEMSGSVYDVRLLPRPAASFPARLASAS